MTDKINIIAIDPGNNTGISIYTLQVPNFNIVGITNKQYILDNMIDDRIPLEKMFKRTLALQIICKELASIYRPICIIEEAAFLNNRFPKAVMQLSQYISTIELTFYNELPGIKFFRYPPKYVKRYIGAGGSAKKDDMTIAINKIEELSNIVNTDTLTEHEIDSLAIGYVGITEIRQYPHLLYMV